jgi:hypothetical protein
MQAAKMNFAVANAHRDDGRRFVVHTRMKTACIRGACRQHHHKRESQHHVGENNAGHHTATLISAQHEQKYLLHNRSNCRYRDCTQSPRAVLGVGSTVNQDARTISIADMPRGDG